MFPGEGERISTYTKKDGTKTIRAEKRYEPSDFIKNGYLKQKIIENTLWTYNEFMQEMAKDVRVLFV